MQHGGHDVLVSAEIDCFVDLDPAQKGVHMSRFPELFEEAIDEVVIGGKLLVEQPRRAHRPPHRRAPAGARAEVRIAARYPMERLTPVTGLRTQELVTLIGIAAASPARARAESSASRRAGSTHAPAPRGSCASRQPSGSARPASTTPTSTASSSSSRSPRTTSEARERSTSARGSVWTREDLVEIVERSMSSPIYELLKRPDELFVVEHAHLAPRFVEDSVRLMIKSALDVYDELERRATSCSPARSTSRRSTTTKCSRSASAPSGELRQRARERRASPRHTELRDWLAAETRDALRRAA